MIAALLVTLCLQSPAPVPAAAPARVDWLGWIARAEREPREVVPLLLAAGETLAGLTGRERQFFGDALEPLLARVYFSGERFPGDEVLGVAVHVVASGDTGAKIARKHGFGHGLLASWNAKYDERRLGIGQKLKHLAFAPGELELVVDRTLFRMSAWHASADGRRTPLFFIPVGLGAADSPTPLGVTKVVERVQDPSWTDPETKVTYPPGDARNILGGWWIELDAGPLGKSGIGLHGYTGAPTADWLSKPGSRGCVRMRQEDCARVYFLALEGTRVVIR
jgi:L,D-transpeptidase ErfK/SrfK